MKYSINMLLNHYLWSRARATAAPCALAERLRRQGPEAAHWTGDRRPAQTPGGLEKWLQQGNDIYRMVITYRTENSGTYLVYGMIFEKNNILKENVAGRPG